MAPPSESDNALLVASRISRRWSGASRFTIVELGFGAGQNFLGTIAAWQTAADRPKRLAYVAIAGAPRSAQDMARALAEAGRNGNPHVDALAQRWPLPLPGLHVLEFFDGAVSLFLSFGASDRALERLHATADAFFLDASGGAVAGTALAQPLLGRLARRARPGATIAVRLRPAAAAGVPAAADVPPTAAVQDALARAGFQTAPFAWDEAQSPDIAGRPSILAGEYAPAWRTYPAPAPDPVWSQRRAIVIGAGLAGCATASALAARDWDVVVFERASSVCAEGSAQPLVADHPHFSPDDNHLARLSRSALLHALRELPPGDGSVGAIGRLALAGDERELEQQRAMMDRLAFPAAFVSAVDADQASELAGVRLRAGGLWLPLCRSVDPAARCRLWLGGGGATTGGKAANGTRISVRFGVAVHRIERRDGLWALFDADGRVLDAAPVLVVAAAGQAPALCGMHGVELRRVRGQTSRLAAVALPGLRTVLGADAYACPLPDGDVLVGSTFDDGSDLIPDPEADRSNLRRLARATGAALGAYLPHVRSAASGFRYVAEDRLPLIGPVPDSAAIIASAGDFMRNDRLELPLAPGLYAAFAFGSRGLLWASLAAQVLAAAIDGGPAPVESDLLAAIAPSRFIRRRLRRHAG